MARNNSMLEIKHDFHIHTNLSLCAGKSATLENYISAAKEIGLYKLGFANHFWDDKIEGASDWYKKQNFSHVLKLKSEINVVNDPNMQLYFGCEVEYDYKRRNIAITEAVAEQFDFIIVPNSHTHMTMPHNFYEPYERHLNFMIDSYLDIINSSLCRYITAVAHPFEAVCCPYPKEILIDMLSDDTLKYIFDKTANRGIAIEINIHELMNKDKIAKECGCKFLFGSDAHSKGQLYDNTASKFFVELIELKSDDIASIGR